MDLTLQVIMEQLKELKTEVTAGREELKNDICTSQEEMKKCHSR
jgi:hypothetical protein